MRVVCLRLKVSLVCLFLLTVIAIVVSVAVIVGVLIVSVVVGLIYRRRYIFVLALSSPWTLCKEFVKHGQSPKLSQLHYA